MSFAVCFNLDQSKILSSGNRLNTFSGYYEPDMVAVKTDQEVLGEIVK